MSENVSNPKNFPSLFRQLLEKTKEGIVFSKKEMNEPYKDFILYL